MKYLSREIIEKAGGTAAVDMTGMISISIGGVPVNENDHVIDCGDSTSVEVIIGSEIYTVELTETDESGMSEALREVRERETRDAEIQAAQEAEAETVTE